MILAVSFACKTIDLQDILRCSFNLNKTEYNLLLFLMKQSESLCASSIGEMVSKDRTTIQKAIKHLLDSDLVHKHQVNLDQGGYIFVYKIKDKEYLRTRILEVVNSWHNSVVNEVKNW